MTTDLPPELDLHAGRGIQELESGRPVIERRSATESMPHPDSRPLVSCLLVTADRPALCRRALASYRSQSYPSRELVVLDNGRVPVEHLFDGTTEEGIKYLRVEPGPSTVIGGLRNVALDAASGQYVVPQWDDDDWSHPERLERQVGALQEGYDACVLAGTLMHVDSAAYFDHPFVGLLPNGVPPTIVHRRDSEIRYPELRRTSDTIYLDQWRQQRVKLLPREFSYLYVRHFHGNNLWEEEHFLRRIRNNVPDAIRFGWYKYVRRNLFSHPRFRLNEDAQEAFRLYLRDSFDLGLFEEHSSGRNRT